MFRLAGRMSPSARILAGLGAGVLVGLFLGDLAGVFKWAADAFVRLLQMTVLPYVTLSIIGSLGALDGKVARALGYRAGAVIIALWAIALTFALLVPLAFPSIESASFYSTSLIERPQPFAFVDLYIPANPFHSLANNVVPAVVLFSVIMGVALIGVPEKAAVLDVVRVATEALSRMTRFVVRLTPYGLFAIAATAAGTLDLEQVGRLQVYLVAYVVVALLISLWVLPGLVAALTPIPVRDILSSTRDALITAFVAADLFIVLPVLIEQSRVLVARHALASEEEQGLPDVIVPASFNLPHSGKLLSLSFVLFAAWFADAALPLAEYPRLALSGLLSFFGSLNVAIPFLLDQFRIPADTFQLFLASGVINSRFGTLVAAVHTVAVALLCTCAMTGALKVNRTRLFRYAAITVVVTAVAIGGTRSVFGRFMVPAYTRDQVLASMQVTSGPMPVTVRQAREPEPVNASVTVLEAIEGRGHLRVGYVPESLPFAFFNGRKELVGLDVDMAYRLAAELGVGLEFVLTSRDAMAADMEAGTYDIVMSGVVNTPQRSAAMLVSRSYLDETLGLVVLDERRADFETWTASAGSPLTVAVPGVPYYVEKIRRLMPSADIRTVDRIEGQLSAPSLGADALAMPAERGSAWTLMYPRYTVVVPGPSPIRLPLAYPIARRDQAFASFVNTFIELKQKDGTIQALYDHWILGRTADRRPPRWSIIRDVLHWID
jgi:Na+/H+-dicarboxylate symporter/ABC-type amino acid transport substrate-binding protein